MKQSVIRRLSIKMLSAFCCFVLGVAVVFVMIAFESVPAVYFVETNSMDVSPSLEIPAVNDVLPAFDQGLSGWYSLDAYPGMEEVSFISLFFEGGKNDSLRKTAVMFTVEESGDSGFESHKVVLENDDITFVTRSHKGIVYEFDGTFFKGRRFGEIEEKLLRGSLRKLVHGKQIAVASGDFKYYEPHCWH